MVAPILAIVGALVLLANSNKATPVKWVALLAICLLLLAGCVMPNRESPNSLRARMLGTSQPIGATAIPSVETPTPAQPTKAATPPPPMGGALADASVIDVNGADPYEVAQALALAVGGVIGFYLFAIGAHWLITRRGAHGRTSRTAT